jgi:hypothetical protein
MPVSIISNFLTTDDINLLSTYFDDKPYTVERTREYQGNTIIYNRHKNSEYELTDGLVHQIIYPKLEKIIGPHAMDNGSFLESHYPYSIHLDTHQTYAEKQFQCHNNNYLNHAVLISLNDDPSFKTVMFDYFADILDYTQTPSESTNTVNTMADPKYADLDFSHMLPHQIEFIRSVKITNVYSWKVGSAVIWPRNQLHASSNYYPSGKQKKALVFFL